MTKKIEFGLICFFIILSFIIPAVAGNPEKSVNIPVYLQTSAGIEKASSDAIREILFNYDFKIDRRQEYVPDEKCSLRAETGGLEIENKTFDKSELSFYIPLKNDGPGKGTLTAQKGRERFSLNFEVQEILKTNSEKLVFRASGVGKLNKEKLNFNSIIVTFDKVSKKVNLIGSGDKNFSVGGLDVGFSSGCSGQNIDFYLILKKSALNEQRTVEEAEALLKQHPELVKMYEGLKNLNGNVPLVPEFGFYAGALIVIGAMGMFFGVRRRYRDSR